MKKLTTIYNQMVKSLCNLTKAHIAPGSLLDLFFLSISEGIYDNYLEIEKNKTPYLYTNLKGKDIDSQGMLVGCQRQEDESDENFLYRMINWNTSNQCSNSTAMDIALMNLKYSSNATEVPFTYGAGTSTIYVIPKIIDEENCKKAINEVKERIKKVKCTTSYVDIKIPKIKKINIIAYINTSMDENNIKNNISNKFEKYINNIAPGDFLSIGKLNSIGVNEPNVGYFSIAKIIIDNKEMQDLEYIQKLEEKFVFDKISWIDK